MGTPWVEENINADLFCATVTAWTDATCSSVFNFVVVGKNEPQKPGSCEQPGPQVLSFSAAC